ncbi:MAG: DUF1840 domain-containing protein [Georgfuchsia sp.]
MLIIFKSRASGDVIMLENNGKEMLSVLGKDSTDVKGIITVEQLPNAITTLKAAIKADEARLKEPENKEEEGESGSCVHLFQRALPLLELLERSMTDKTPVIWGI